MMTVLAWLWHWLPDRCEIAGCERRGVRGNENRVDGLLMCDDCTVRHRLIQGQSPEG